MKLITYLFFCGQCKKAFKFYATCLGGKIEAMVPYGKAPASSHFNPGWRSKIVHARLAIGDSILMGTDLPSDRYQDPRDYSVLLDVRSVEEAERLFQSLGQGGTVRLQLEENFFAIRYGTLVDRFGIPWMIVYQRPT